MLRFQLFDCLMVFISVTVFLYRNSSVLFTLFNFSFCLGLAIYGISIFSPLFFSIKYQCEPSYFPVFHATYSSTVKRHNLLQENISRDKRILRKQLAQGTARHTLTPELYSAGLVHTQEKSGHTSCMPCGVCDCRSFSLHEGYFLVRLEFFSGTSTR